MLRSTSPSRTGTSCANTLLIANVPSPGSTNTCSMITEPPSNWAMRKPSTVTTGMAAFLRPCLTTIFDGRSPFARVARMKSRCPTSINEARSWIVSSARGSAARAKAGSTSALSHVQKPSDIGR